VAEVHDLLEREVRYLYPLSFTLIQNEVRDCAAVVSHNLRSAVPNLFYSITMPATTLRFIHSAASWRTRFCSRKPHRAGLACRPLRTTRSDSPYAITNNRTRMSDDYWRPLLSQFIPRSFAFVTSGQVVLTASPPAAAIRRRRSSETQLDCGVRPIQKVKTRKIGRL
jgi:hypothetical protein